MSPENVEIVRRALGAAWKRPTPDVATVNALYHPEHVLESNWGAEGGTYRGAHGLRQVLADMDDFWDEWRQEIDEVINAGPDRVVVVARLVARGKSSGAPVDSPWAMVLKLDRGQIVSTRVFVRPEDAFAAAGLCRSFADGPRGPLLNAKTKHAKEKGSG
jgi:ketosteroid isomerase-like protein